jgi:hypothetical protein
VTVERRKPAGKGLDVGDELVAHVVTEVSQVVVPGTVDGDEERRDARLVS